MTADGALDMAIPLAGVDVIQGAGRLRSKRSRQLRDPDGSNLDR
jgi:hypothetical protein